MKTIIIKTQAELDALPDSFAEQTIIEIRSEPSAEIKIIKQYNSARVSANDSARVYALDFATVQMLSIFAVIVLYDYSVVSVRGFKSKTKIVRKHKTTTVINTPPEIRRSFKEWLKLGYVHADGITKKLISKKKIGNIEVFEVEEFIERSNSFVVKKGNVFSHGKTIKEAKESLVYKISSRDTSEFKKWKLTDVKSRADLIRAYRAITGACEFGTKQFCESQKLKAKYSVNEVIKITEGKYGNKEFAEFFK